MLSLALASLLAASPAVPPIVPSPPGRIRRPRPADEDAPARGRLRRPEIEVHPPGPEELKQIHAMPEPALAKRIQDARTELEALPPERVREPESIARKRAELQTLLGYLEGERIDRRIRAGRPPFPDAQPAQRPDARAASVPAAAPARTTSPPAPLPAPAPPAPAVPPAARAAGGGLWLRIAATAALLVALAAAVALVARRRAR